MSQKDMMHKPVRYNKSYHSSKKPCGHEQGRIHSKEKNHKGQ